MRSVRMVLSVGLALLIAVPVLAGEKKHGDKKPPKCPVEQAIENVTKGLDLSADQKTKLAEIQKAMAPQCGEIMKKQDVLTPEQKKARAEAAKAAKNAGKKGKEAQQAIDEAIKLTPEQKAKMDEVKKAKGAFDKELKEKVLAVLTPEQKEKVAPPKKHKKEKK